MVSPENRPGKFEDGMTKASGRARDSKECMGSEERMFVSPVLNLGRSRRESVSE